MRPPADRVFALVIFGTMCLFAAAFAAPVAAQNAPMAQGPAPLPPAEVVAKVGVQQNLNAQVPLDLVFRDETGKTVRLGDYFDGAGGRPVILTPVYYECPMLCTMTLNGLVTSFAPLTFTVGDEFDVITFSFDPSETPELAAAKKKSYLERYGREGAGDGWHFLTGDEENIKALTEAIGFRYARDEYTDQYAHASSIMVLTPTGRISRYFYGLEYSTRDLRLGLVEAAEERIGSLADEIVLLCFKYDPTTGKYGWAVMGLLRVGAVLTLGALGTFMFVSLRRDRRIARATAAAAPPPADDQTTDGRPSTGS